MSNSKTSDAISRSAVLEILCDGCNSRNKTAVPRCGDMCSDFKGVLSLPALDVAPVVHARWIHDINNLYGCSECMARETMSNKKLKQFCPNCGARMDGEADG